MLFKRNYIVLLTLLIVAFSSCAKKSSIVKIYSFFQARETLSTCSPDSIVFFDIDNTLISTPDVIGRTLHFPKEFLAKLYVKHPSFLLAKTWEHFLSFMWYHEPRLIIEPMVIELIKALKQNHTPVFGFTALQTGTFGIIEDMVTWRYEMLSSMGIFFTRTLYDHIFNECKPHNGQYPVFHRGIIYTNTLKKGDILSPFLDHLALEPDQIIVFDDNRKQLENIEQACEKLDIPVFLYHYCGAEKLPGTWDNKRAFDQIHFIMTQQRWVSDAEYSQMQP